jgi:glutamate synthase (NADPH/NADH) small chain
MGTPQQRTLRVPEEAERLLEARRILREDVLGTIDHAETTGEKFTNASIGRSLASWKPARVTFWVEYSRVGDEYLVHSAYSHRMEMKRGTGS